MEEKIKNWLNNLFLERQQGSTKAAINSRYSTFVGTLNEAALNWMVIEIDSYLTLLTSRQCTSIKVWRTVEKDNVFDVFFRIQAKGRSTPEFDLKTYVKFPEKDKCLFELEDWSAGINGHVNGRVVKNNGLFKCEEVPVQTNIPAPTHDYLEDDRREG